MAGYGYNPFGGGYGQPTPQMYAQQAYMQQMAQQPAQIQQPNVITRMVTSREEATTAQIPFDSTINVYLNPGAGEIYVKQFNPQTGGAVFRDYVDTAKVQQAMQQAQEQKQPEYVTAERFAELENRVNDLTEAMSTKRKRGVQADE